MKLQSIHETKGALMRMCSMIGVRTGVDKKATQIEIFINKKLVSKLCLIVMLLKNVLKLSTCYDIFGVHYPAQEKLGCFEVNYIFISFSLAQRFRIRFRVSEFDTIPSMTSIFKSANWLERETFDMFGIFFINHPDLRRILTDYFFTGHPLRKDFPSVGFFEVRLNHETKLIEMTPIKLTQSFRNYTFHTNPWLARKLNS